MMDQLNRFLDPLRRRVANMVARGILQLINDVGPIQQVQATTLSGEVHDQIDRVQEYGFFSVPKSGSECVVLFIGGSQGHGVVIATDDRRTRPKSNAPGDSGLWTTSGALLALRDSTKNLEGTVGKISIGNGTSNQEIMNLLSRICAFLRDGRTVMDQQSLVSPNDTIVQIKADVDAIAKNPHS